MTGDASYWKSYFRTRLSRIDFFSWRTKDERDFPGHAEQAAANMSLLLFIAELFPFENLTAAATFALAESPRPHLNESIEEALRRVRAHFDGADRYAVERLMGREALSIGVGAAQISSIMFIAFMSQPQRDGLVLAFPQRKWTAFAVSKNAVDFGEAVWLLRATVPHWIDLVSPTR